MALPRQRQQADGLDKAAKIKLAAACVALLLAGVVIASYLFEFSLFGGGSGPAAASEPVAPEVQAERTRQIQEQKKTQEDIKTKNPNVKTTGS